jgi:hypothetical protein
MALYQVSDPEQHGIEIKETQLFLAVLSKSRLLERRTCRRMSAVQGSAYHYFRCNQTRDCPE